MELLTTSVLLVFATFAVSYALVYLDGAWGLLCRLRAIPAIKRFGVLDCVACTSMYISFVFTLCAGFTPILFLGVWGIVVFLDIYISTRVLK